jgi:uncharacterized protein HemY
MGISGSPESATKTVANAELAHARAEPAREDSAEFIPSPTLAEEVHRLDGVRKLLAAGDAQSALASLDALARRVPQPRLGPEATLLRAQALMALGRTEEARRLVRKP